MNCVLFAKIDKFSVKKKQKIEKSTRKMKENTGSQGKGQENFVSPEKCQSMSIQQK